MPENTLIQVVNLKKIHVPAEYRARLTSNPDRRDATRPRTLTLLVTVNFTAYFFSLGKMPIDMNMLVFFLRKCVRTAAKTVVVDRINQKALALLCLASGRCKMLRTRALCRPSSHQNRQQR